MGTPFQKEEDFCDLSFRALILMMIGPKNRIPETFLKNLPKF